MPALAAQYSAAPAIGRRPSPEEMLSTLRRSIHRSVAARKAAVNCIGASRSTRKAVRMASAPQSSSGPVPPTMPALLMSVALAICLASCCASQSRSRAASGAASARSADHCVRRPPRSRARLSSDSARPREMHKTSASAWQICSAIARPMPREAPVRMVRCCMGTPFRGLCPQRHAKKRHCQ